MKYLILSGIFCLASLSAIEPNPFTRVHDKKFQEAISLDFPKSEVWVVKNHATSKNGSSIIEYLPQEQAFNNRSELVMIQFFPHASKHAFSSVKQYVDAIRVSSKQKYSDMKWKTIKQSTNDITYEWSLPNGYKNFPPQDEIVRIIWTEQGIYCIAYERKVAKMDVQKRAQWLKFIESAKVIVVPSE